MTPNRTFAWLLASLAAAVATSAQAGESYANIGIPGLMLGYAHTLSPTLGLRADFATLGSTSRDFEESGIRYKGTIKAQRVGLFADYFPMQGGFRLTGGLTFNRMRAQLKSQFDGATSVTVGSQTITPASTDYFNAEVKFPRVTPYLGLGWGHQARERGLGFVADAGVMIGKAKITTQDNVVGRFGITQADVDAEAQKLRDGAGDITVIPQLTIGVSYRY
ncbi:MAG: hypothetical protein EOP38_08470 [Rubrivivax sp.]|nr:MAG: hypothetical protein EOP38_08470 [Rubrivivax sp.]